ncbi:MAG: methylated-DNA--[protein]-cysteine S-methyltransferase [Bacteroidota bacterium]
MLQTQYIMASPVGALAITANEEAVNAVLFIKEDSVIPTVGESSNQLIKKCVSQLNEYFAGTRKVFDLPLQQNGSVFQQNVWQQLLKIDYGKTISYLQLSKRVGDAKAIRAVGTTNGKNKIAIIVPCHRVIGSDGSLTGYAGELWRKKWLLEHEGKFANGVQTLF